MGWFNHQLAKKLGVDIGWYVDFGNSQSPPKPRLGRFPMSTNVSGGRWGPFQKTEVWKLGWKGLALGPSTCTSLEFPWNNWVLIVFHPNNQTRPLVNVAQNGESVKTHRSAGWWTRLQLGRRKARSANITGDLAVEIWFLFIWFCWVTGFQLKVWGFQLRVGKNEINMMISQTLDYGTIWYDFTWNDMMWSMNELFIQICMIIWLEFCMNKLCFWWT